MSTGVGPLRDLIVNVPLVTEYGRSRHCGVASVSFFTLIVSALVLPASPTAVSASHASTAVPLIPGLAVWNATILT